jgi:hypothetical protein
MNIAQAFHFIILEQCIAFQLLTVVLKIKIRSNMTMGLVIFFFCVFSFEHVLVTNILMEIVGGKG